MMDPLQNEPHMGGLGNAGPSQADQLRSMTRVQEQLVPKIETNIIDITPQHHLEHQSLDSPQKIDSPIDGDSNEGNIGYESHPQ